MSGVRVRYAPSPTGDPHIGNIRTALFNWLYARHSGGAFIVRIEDTDAAREQEGSAQAIFDSLAWLGIDYDEGPGVGGPHGPYHQSQRRHIYQPLVDELIAGDSAYRCYCSKERLQALREAQESAGQPTGYDRNCRDLPPGSIPHDSPFTVRLKAPLEGSTTFHDALRGDITFQNSSKVDPVLIKANGMPVYHFANVVDDHLMGITHVLRAEEWISSTPLHVLLYSAFGWDQPKFVHLPLVMGADRRKLSKRSGIAGTLRYRDEGYLPDALVNFLSLLGWSPGENRELMSREQIIDLFTLDGLLSHSAVFDRPKLDWMNGEYIRALSPHDLFERAEPYLRTAGLIAADLSPAEREYAISALQLVQERVKRLDELPHAAAFLFQREPEMDPKARSKWLDRSGSRPVLNAFLEKSAALDHYVAADLEAAAREVAECLHCGTGQVFHPLRVAVSGRTEGPSLFHMLEVLGRDVSVGRIKKAAALAAE